MRNSKNNSMDQVENSTVSTIQEADKQHSDHVQHAGTLEALRAINKRTGRNMPQAIATGVLLVAIIVGCLLISIDAFVFLLVFFMVLALWELHVDFATIGLRIPFASLTVCSVATIVATYYAKWHAAAMAIGITTSLLVTLVIATFHSTVSSHTLRAVEKKVQETANVARREHSALTNTAVALFVILYIPLLASCLVLTLSDSNQAMAHAMLLVFLPALSDTGGLLAGAWLGKHKLSPRISPKKSIEGLLGSMLFAVIGAYIIVASNYGASWYASWWVPLLMGVLSGVVGTFGDLCASMLKRDIGIKDMGHLLKGHGGVLDRVDSILLCAPVMLVLLKITGL